METNRTISPLDVEAALARRSVHDPLLFANLITGVGNEAVEGHWIHGLIHEVVTRCMQAG